MQKVKEKRTRANRRKTSSVRRATGKKRIRQSRRQQKSNQTNNGAEPSIRLSPVKFTPSKEPRKLHVRDLAGQGGDPIQTLKIAERLYKIMSGWKHFKPGKFGPNVTPGEIVDHLISEWDRYCNFAGKAGLGEYILSGPHNYNDEDMDAIKGESLDSVSQNPFIVVLLASETEDPCWSQPGIGFLPELDEKDPALAEMICIALSLLWSKGFAICTVWYEYAIDQAMWRAEQIRATCAEHEAEEFDADEHRYTIKDAEGLEQDIAYYHEVIDKVWLEQRIIPYTGKVHTGGHVSVIPHKRKPAIKKLRAKMKAYRFNSPLKRFTRDWFKQVIELVTLPDFHGFWQYCEHVPEDEHYTDDAVYPDGQIFFRWGHENMGMNFIDHEVVNIANGGPMSYRTDISFRRVWVEGKDKGNPFELKRSDRAPKLINEMFSWAERIFNRPKGGYVKLLNKKVLSWHSK
jgi:hypothetical protein